MLKVTHLDDTVCMSVPGRAQSSAHLNRMAKHGQRDQIFVLP